MRRRMRWVGGSMPFWHQSRRALSINLFWVLSDFMCVSQSHFTNKNDATKFDILSFRGVYSTPISAEPKPICVCLCVMCVALQRVLLWYAYIFLLLVVRLVGLMIVCALRRTTRWVFRDIILTVRAAFFQTGLNHLDLVSSVAIFKAGATKTTTTYKRPTPKCNGPGGWKLEPTTCLRKRNEWLWCGVRRRQQHKRANRCAKRVDD